MSSNSVRAKLDLLDLCACADACSRFRKNAKAGFGDYEVKKFNFPMDISLGFDSPENWLRNASKVLRLFGELIEIYIIRNMPPINFAGGVWDGSKPLRGIIQLINRYCKVPAIDLNLSMFVLGDDIVDDMRPLFERLRTFSSFGCVCSELWLREFALRSQELRELNLYSIDAFANEGWSFGGLHQPFRKLTKITFESFGKLSNYDIEEILKRNPQLKEICFRSCLNINDNILHYIAEYVPGIESLFIFWQINFCYKRKNLKYLGQLKNLSNLSLSTSPFNQNSQFPDLLLSLVCELANAEIPLKKLALSGDLQLPGGVGQFVDGILKLGQLETLYLGLVDGLNVAHAIEFCVRLKELSLNLYPLPTASDLLAIVRNAEKLECLCLEQVSKCNTINIDVETFRKMVEMVEQRPIKTHLNLDLRGNYSGVGIPSDELARAKNSLTLILSPCPQRIVKIRKFTIFDKVWLIICSIIRAVIHAISMLCRYLCGLYPI